MKKKILIVISDYYKDISKGLLNSAKKEIDKTFIIKVIYVPGVFEIPITISKNIKLKCLKIYLMDQNILH